MKLNTTILFFHTVAKEREPGEVQEYNDPVPFPYCSLCEWKNAHGKEINQFDNPRSMDRATIRLRYNQHVDKTCKVKKVGDPCGLWDIIAIDNIRNECMWMELTLERVSGT